MDGPRDRDGVLPLLVVSVVVVAVGVGFSRGADLANLHNGLLAVGFVGVAAYVLHQQPGNRCGWAFLATGVVEAVMFLGRQIGRTPTARTSAWWGWLGVWPLVVGLALVTLSVILFPDGRLPSPGWTWVIRMGSVVTVILAMISALWPVALRSAGVMTPHPLSTPGETVAAEVWSIVARPVFAAFQVLWVIAVAVRWRASSPMVRRQLTVVAVPVAASIVALAIGFVGWRTPTPGLLTACLVPVAAGWAIVHRQSQATQSALTWLAHGSLEADEPSAALAGALAETLSAPRAIVWAVRGKRLHAVGAWPGSTDDIAPVADIETTSATGSIRRPISSNGVLLGAVTVDRAAPLSRHEEGLLDGLTAHAALVMEHLTLAAAMAGGRRVRLDDLTPREHGVLELMSKGLTNAAICNELHLSIKTIEPVVSSIFAKLDLPSGADTNRRVLAVLSYEQRRQAMASDP